MVAEIEQISGMEIKIKRSVLINMLWVLKHANPQLLTAWYSSPCIDSMPDSVSNGVCDVI